MTWSTEDDRIHRHFTNVEAMMESRDTRAVDPEQRLVQSLLLDELARYRRARRFPRNRHLPGEQVPCFIDDSGTRCAVAHLMEVSGHGAQAATIARTRNFARVHEMSDDPGLAGWLAATGFTVDEAAAIQPEYCYITMATVCFCMSWSPTLAEGIVLGSGTQDGGFNGNVLIERIEGKPTELKVGDIVSAHLASTGPERTVLLSVRPPQTPGGPPEVSQLGVKLDPDDSKSTCEYFNFSRDNPVNRQALVEALSAADQSACETRLAQEDPRWKTSRCEDSPPSDSSCAMRQPDRSSTSSAITTAGALAAILSYRRRRQRARR